MTTVANNGRIYLPKDLRERFGDKYHIVEKGDKIVLVPVSEDPLEALRQEFSEVDKSVEELKEGALDTAMKEAGN
jgi:AbrB family looped-hinge helix DNA binding protein